MSAFFRMDPHAAVQRLIWRNRLAQWRAQPAESLFIALALFASVLIVGWLMVVQGPSWGAALRALLTQAPLAVAMLLGVLVACVHYRHRHQQRLQWAGDWLSAQPIAAKVRWRRRWRIAGSLVLTQGIIVAIALGLSDAAGSLLPAMLIVLTAALCGQWLADITSRQRPHLRRSVRETPFINRGRGSLQRWQWIEITASLAPKRLAILLAVACVLVPRGSMVMVFPTLVLLTVLTVLGAWQRSLGVIVHAHVWLAEQPVAARHWLPRMSVLPLIWLVVACALAALACTLADARLLRWMVLLPIPAFALLHLACTMAYRAQPSRIALSMSINSLLLLATAQALPPLSLALWLMQMGWLIRRSLSDRTART